MRKFWLVLTWETRLKRGRGNDQEDGYKGWAAAQRPNLTSRYRHLISNKAGYEVNLPTNPILSEHRPLPHRLSAFVRRARRR
jgi:hypothetical protein